MKTSLLITAAIIAALTLAAVGSSFAEQQSSGTSCCSYMESNACAQYMQGIGPEQKLDLDKNLQKKVEPAGPEYYPGGRKYLPAY